MPRSRFPLLVALLLSGCAATDPSPATAPTDQISTVLFFGLGRSDGSTIADTDFDAFAEREIAPRFPDGYTILRGDGHWREKGRVYGEPSRILWIIHPADPDADAKIEQLRAVYCRQFQQTSVLRLDQSAAKVLF